MDNNSICMCDCTKRIMVDGSSRGCVKCDEYWDMPCLGYDFPNQSSAQADADVIETPDPRPGLPTALCMLLGAYIEDVNADLSDRAEAAIFESFVAQHCTNDDSAASLLEGNGARWVLAGAARRPPSSIPSRYPEVDQLVSLARTTIEQIAYTNANTNRD